jgi:hypothetical protein
VPSVLQNDAVATGRAAEARGVAPQAYHWAMARLASRWEILPLAALAIVTSIVYLQTAPVFGLPFDDSYISLLFARNLAEHGFLTFDGEDASAGATSLLHVAVLAVPIKLGATPERASVALGVASQLGLLVTVYWLAWTLFRDRLAAAIAGASIAIVGYLVYDALNGMETTLFLALSTSGTAAFYSGRSVRWTLAAGVLVALAVLTRPEGVLLLGAMALYRALEALDSRPVDWPSTSKQLALLAGPALVTLVGLAILYWATTGTPTPGAATAKFLFFREFEHPVTTKFDWTLGNVANFVAPVLPWVALSIFAVRRREALVFAFYWTAFVIGYFVLFPGGLGHYWFRYQHIFLPAIVVFGAGGLAMLLRKRDWRPLELAGAAALAVVLIGTVALQYNAYRHRYADDVRTNETRQVEIARYVREQLPPGGAVATHDIGVIGYFCECKVIDLVGLVNSDVTDYHDGRHLREYVDRVQPDLIVVFPGWEASFLQLGLDDDPALFEKLRVFPAPAGPSEDFVVYRTHY